MSATPADWRVQVKQGRRALDHRDLRHEARRRGTSRWGSWSCGWRTAARGVDPFTARRSTSPGVLTHGHLPENDNHGGGADAPARPARRCPTGPRPPASSTSYDFRYQLGRHERSAIRCQPAGDQAGPVAHVPQRRRRRRSGIWHTITACKAPCDRATGIAYPLADGNVQFDSGELGSGGAAGDRRVSWSTPTNLPPGTYTYFCRIHPFMRGAFRVKQ